MTTISNLYILYQKINTDLLHILTPMSCKGVTSCNDGKTIRPKELEKRMFSQNPLGVGGCPLGYGPLFP